MGPAGPSAEARRHGVIDLDIELDIEHSWVGELTVTLTHENTGTTVTLLSRPGRPRAIFGCSRDDISVILDDSAEEDVEDMCEEREPRLVEVGENQQASCFLYEGA